MQLIRVLFQFFSAKKNGSNIFIDILNACYKHVIIYRGDKKA